MNVVYFYSILKIVRCEANAFTLVESLVSSFAAIVKLILTYINTIFELS